MKLLQRISPLILSTCIITLSSCGENKKADKTNKSNDKEQPIVKSYEEILQDQVTAFEELADTIEDITDVEVARNSIGALSEIGFKLNRLKTDLENSETVSDNKKVELQKKYHALQNKALIRVSSHMSNLKKTQPNAATIIDGLMESIL